MLPYQIIRITLIFFNTIAHGNFFGQLSVLHVEGDLIDWLIDWLIFIMPWCTAGQIV